MTVNCEGGGEGEANLDLELQIWVGGVKRNRGDGDYIGMTGMWDGDVAAPPPDGFPVGVATLRVYLASASPFAGDPLVTRTFEFD